MDEFVLSPLISPLSVLVWVNFQRRHKEVEVSLLKHDHNRAWAHQTKDNPIIGGRLPAQSSRSIRQPNERRTHRERGFQAGTAKLLDARSSIS